MSALLQAASTLEAALHYAARGWAVVLMWWVVDHQCACGAHDCASSGKHPIGFLVQHGSREASTHPTRILEWCRRYPRANLGIVTGRVSKLLVLDIDPRHGGDDSLHTLEQRFGALPVTARCLTGGGGQHLYFLWQEPRPAPNGILAPGIDVKGDAGLVVAPPSIHLSGRPYAWDVTLHPDEVGLAPVPSWVLDELSAYRQSSTARRVDTVSTLAGVPEGQRDDTLFRLACKLRRADVPRNIAEALVLDAATRCVPPFPTKLALAKVASAYGRYSVGREAPPLGLFERRIRQKVRRLTGGSR